MSRDALHILSDADGVHLHWPRLAAEQLFVGRQPDEVSWLAPSLFALCGHAQGLAARLALAAAAGMPIRAGDDALHAVQQEAIRETLRRWLLDWAPACGQRIAANEVRALGEAGSMPALQKLAAESVFGGDIANWRACDLAGWQHWASQGSTAAARALTRLLDDQPEPLPVLQILPDAAALATETDWLNAQPQWQGRAVETGALASYQPLLQDWLDAGHVSAARLLARLLGLADALCGQLPAASSARLGPAGLACVQTARGPLLHLATLGDDGRVAAYRILPPTLWHAHPAGCMAQAAQSGSDEAIYRRLLLIDPCVAITLANQNDKESCHA